MCSSTAGVVTKLVELRVQSSRPGDRADQTGLQEGAPAVYQAPLTTHIILFSHKNTRYHCLYHLIFHWDIDSVWQSVFRCCRCTIYKVVHLANPSHSAINTLVPLARLNSRLLEEEVNLVIVCAVGVRD